MSLISTFKYQICKYQIFKYALILNFPSCLINLKSFNNNKRRRRSAPSHPKKRGVVSDPKGKTQSAERISGSKRT